MRDELSFELHALTARLDRVANRVLQEEFGISYRRFLVLFMVGSLGAKTQRALAERLDVSEPSVSRMTGLLSAAGLLEVQRDPEGGNRRNLALTIEGERLAKACRELLAARFREVVDRSGIPSDDYAHHTRQLLDALGEDSGLSTGRWSEASGARPAAPDTEIQRLARRRADGEASRAGGLPR